MILIDSLCFGIFWAMVILVLSEWSSETQPQNHGQVLCSFRIGHGKPIVEFRPGFRSSSIQKAAVLRSWWLAIAWKIQHLKNGEKPVNSPTCHHRIHQNCQKKHPGFDMNCVGNWTYLDIISTKAGTSSSAGAALAKVPKTAKRKAFIETKDPWSWRLRQDPVRSCKIQVDAQSALKLSSAEVFVLPVLQMFENGDERLIEMNRDE